MAPCTPILLPQDQDSRCGRQGRGSCRDLANSSFWGLNCTRDADPGSGGPCSRSCPPRGAHALCCGEGLWPGPACSRPRASPALSIAPPLTPASPEPWSDCTPRSRICTGAADTCSTARGLTAQGTRHPPQPPPPWGPGHSERPFWTVLITWLFSLCLHTPRDRELTTYEGSAAPWAALSEGPFRATPVTCAT